MVGFFGQVIGRALFYEGGVVRLTRPEDNDVVYWRDVCGNLWFSDNEMYI
jgi:hypothetical protein